MHDNIPHCPNGVHAKIAGNKLKCTKNETAPQPTN